MWCGVYGTVLCDNNSVGGDPEEISFQAGDIMTGVIETEEEGWWEGTHEKTGKRGLFPNVSWKDLKPDNFVYTQ